MTRDDIIRMAREAGFEIGLNEHGQSILKLDKNRTSRCNRASFIHARRDGGCCVLVEL